MIVSNIRSWLRTLPVLVFGGWLLANPEAAAQGFMDGCTLCLHQLLPALFPFFVVCGAVARLFRAKNNPVWLLILCWLGGYAVCARLLRDMCDHGGLDHRRAQTLLILGCCSGPGFVIGCIGGQMLGSVTLGVLLYFLQLACNFVVAIPAVWMARGAAPGVSGLCASKTEGGLSADIAAAVDSCLYVCGCVIFFRIVYTVCIPGPSSFLSRMLCAGLEITAACADYAAAGGREALYGVCLCLSLLGVSVFTQIRWLLPRGLSIKPLLWSRLLHAAAMQGMVRLFARLLPGAVAVFTNLEGRVIPMNRARPDAAFTVFLFLCALLYKARYKIYNEK